MQLHGVSARVAGQPAPARRRGPAVPAGPPSASGGNPPPPSSSFSAHERGGKAGGARGGGRPARIEAGGGLIRRHGCACSAWFVHASRQGTRHESIKIPTRMARLVITRESRAGHCQVSPIMRAHSRASAADSPPAIAADVRWFRCPAFDADHSQRICAKSGSFVRVGK